jgi:transcription-repair coupling factor (superfamily II helicase)
MTGYFTSSDNSPYYQSGAFGKVLYYIQNHAVRTKLREGENRRSIVFSDVKTVKTAYDILKRIDEN